MTSEEEAQKLFKYASALEIAKAELTELKMQAHVVNMKIIGLNHTIYQLTKEMKRGN